MGAMPDISDESLMLQYCEGDLLAFQELYRRHRIGLYRFIAWRSPRAEWIDEVVQDSWANLHHARARYTPEAQFRTYLYQIARNRLLDLLRQHQPILASDLDGFDALADVAQDVTTPEAQLQDKQRSIGLQRALAALPGEQKEAVVLQQFDGMSLEDIAALVSAPVETVKSRLRYAMRKLRQEIKNDE